MYKENENIQAKIRPYTVNTCTSSKRSQLPDHWTTLPTADTQEIYRNIANSSFCLVVRSTRYARGAHDKYL